MQTPKKTKGRADRGLIVVGIIAGIIAITTAGGCLLNQAPDALGDSAPSWSADSARVAFSSDETGNQDIYVMNARRHWASENHGPRSQGHGTLMVARR